MSGFEAYVFNSSNLADFIQHVLSNHTTPSWLIICSTRHDFQQRLTSLLGQDREKAPNTARDVKDYLGKGLGTQPTLRDLAACKTLRIAFTPDIVRLRAFLASLPRDSGSSMQHTKRQSVIAILDLVELHKSTLSCSAQGLNRTFATAIQAALDQNSILILCETEQKQQTTFDGDNNIRRELSIWDEDIGIVDTRTKTFGPGNRAWVGRTIQVRSIAERWMSFKSPTSFNSTC